MNLLIDGLPTSVEISGQMVEINTDFRTGILFEEALQDPELDDLGKLRTALDLYFPGVVFESSAIDEAVSRLIWFYRCGDDSPRRSGAAEDSSAEDPAFSYEYDADYIYSAFLQAYGMGCKFFGRYTDDTHIISDSKELLMAVLDGVREIAKEYGIIINERKTRICKLSSFYRYLQIGYSLTDTGRVIRKINPKSITRERRKLKAYKRKLDAGTMSYADVENSFKSWLGGNWKSMSRQQISNMSLLYYPGRRLRLHQLAEKPAGREPAALLHLGGLLDVLAGLDRLLRPLAILQQREHPRHQRPRGSLPAC